MRFDEGNSNECPPMGNSKPDMYYKDKDVIIIGEAKANKDDLRKGYNPNQPENLHLARQINDYITYLMTQKKKKRKKQNHTVGDTVLPQ